MRTLDAGAKLRELLSTGETLAVPGTFSPVVALLAKKAGFKCIYFSGAAFSGLLGLPDLGITTMTEVADAVTKITSVVTATLPLIVDVDTGFGEVVNVSRTISEMERAGAAAIQIEDQVLPKKCGHLSGKELVDAEEMVKKVIAAKDARKTKMVIVARTDAAAVEGLDHAIERAKLYAKAGAEMIFPEALTSKEEFVEFAEKVGVPLVANMTEFGKTPYFTVSQFSSMGYKLVLFPVTAFRLALNAVQKGLDELARSGTQRNLVSKMMTREDFYKIINYDSFEKLDQVTTRKADELFDTN